MHGQQVPRLAGNVLDLLAQLHDQLIEGAGGAVVIDAPDFRSRALRANRVTAPADHVVLSART
jgi:hypothetical protein